MFKTKAKSVGGGVGGAKNPKRFKEKKGGCRERCLNDLSRAGAAYGRETQADRGVASRDCKESVNRPSKRKKRDPTTIAAAPTCSRRGDVAETIIGLPGPEETESGGEKFRLRGS